SSSSQMTRRLCGSRPVVGSSRKKKRGRWISPRAISSRRRLPPGYVPPPLSRHAHRPPAGRSSPARCSPALRPTPYKRAASPPPDAIEARVEIEALERGEIPVHGVGLRNHPDRAAHLAGARNHVVPHHERPAGRRLEERVQHADQGALSGPVGAEDAEDLALI